MDAKRSAKTGQWMLRNTRETIKYKKERKKTVYKVRKNFREKEEMKVERRAGGRLVLAKES